MTPPEAQTVEGGVGNLAGRVAVVTGASKGIGQQTAIRLARDGASVVVNYHSDEAGARATVSKIERAGGVAVAVQADIGEPASVDSLIASAIEQLSRVDVLVNNAAIYPWCDFGDISPEEWDRVFAVNVRGAFLAARAASYDMRSRQWGRIISLGSTTFLNGSAELMHYAASKGAIVGLTRSLARALGDYGITVNTVMTGRTLTEGLEELFDQGALSMQESIQSRSSQSIKRLATPADIVGCISFLASDDASYITGQSVNVDGGRTMY